MTPRSLWLVGLFAMLALAASVFALHHADHSADVATKGGLLFPELVGKTGNIARIEILGAGDLVMLEKQGVAWTLPAKDHYPADSAQIGQMISILAGIELLEQKTSDPARYSDLDLGPPGKDAGAGREIKLEDGKGGVLADAVIGRNAVNLGRTGGGFYVRRTDRPASWLVEGMIELPETLLDWTDHNLFGLVDPGAIKTVTLKADARTIVSVSRDKPDDETFAVMPAPPGRTDQGKALRLATLPVSLSFSDIRMAAVDDGKPSRAASFQGFAGGTAYRLELYAIGKENWVKASESGSGDEVKRYNDFHAKWLYKLPAYRTELLLSDIKDFSAKTDIAHPKGP